MPSPTRRVCWRRLLQRVRRSSNAITFSMPCRLRELLDLPPCWGDFREIPDSVEVLGFTGYLGDSYGYTLDFGRESRLVRVTAAKDPRLFAKGNHGPFLRVTSRSLKIFRSDLEFVESGLPHVNNNACRLLISSLLFCVVPCSHCELTCRKSETISNNLA
jgi:hypothetical protein